MSKQENKRTYRQPLDFVQLGFIACWQNANDLVTASKSLIEARLHAPALSLAVLALEELGKLCAIDGLLFARPDDHKSATASKADRSHSLKLDILTIFPLLIGNLSRTDPRYGIEAAYNAALAISITQLKADGNSVLNYLPDKSFRQLDVIKQRGFYANAVGQKYLTPRDAVDPALSQAVYHFAWRATSTLDFVMKDGNLERYLKIAHGIRAKATEQEHQFFEQLGKEAGLDPAIHPAS
jgi:AbiV family abortive infection protein